ncbi:hypothetical protein GCM10009736_57760 [Actinomadura bangladeshensis]
MGWQSAGMDDSAEHRTVLDDELELVAGECGGRKRAARTSPSCQNGGSVE